MTQNAHETATESHGLDHVPHVLGLPVYLATWGGLVVLTGVTVAASYVNLGPWNLALALAIATIKAVAVSAIFMHLWFDHKFHAIIFGSALVFLAIFIGFTLIDTENRGRVDATLGDHPVDIANPFGETRSQAAIKSQYGGRKPPADTKPQGSASP